MKYRRETLALSKFEVRESEAGWNKIRDTVALKFMAGEFRYRQPRKLDAARETRASCAAREMHDYGRASSKRRNLRSANYPF